MYKISVVLPTYNGGTRGEGKYLRQAIESVLNQTYENFELIIVNDCSTDNTEDIIKKYRDKRIIYLQHGINKGPSAARNSGIQKSTGDYIVFLDDDDYYYRDKLEKQLKFTIENGAYVSICDGDLVDDQGKIIKETRIDKKQLNMLGICKEKIPPNIHSFMIKKDETFSELYFKEYLKTGEDWDLLVRLALICPIYSFDHKLFAYRFHKLNSSKNLDNMYFYRLLCRYELKNNLIKYYKKREHYYYDILRILYRVDILKEFRKFYKYTKPLAKTPLEWKIKYICSYSSILTKFLIRLKIKRMFSLFFDNY